MTEALVRVRQRSACDERQLRLLLLLLLLLSPLLLYFYILYNILLYILYSIELCYIIYNIRLLLLLYTYHYYYYYYYTIPHYYMRLSRHRGDLFVWLFHRVFGWDDWIVRVLCLRGPVSRLLVFFVCSMIDRRWWCLRGCRY